MAVSYTKIPKHRLGIFLNLSPMVGSDFERALHFNVEFTVFLRFCA